MFTIRSIYTIIIEVQIVMLMYGKIKPYFFSTGL